MVTLKTLISFFQTKSTLLLDTGSMENQNDSEDHWCRAFPIWQ